MPTLDITLKLLRSPPLEPSYLHKDLLNQMIDLLDHATIRIVAVRQPYAEEARGVGCERTN